MTNFACRYALRQSETLLCVRVLSHLVLSKRIAQSKYYAHNLYLQKVINNVSNQFLVPKILFIVDAKWNLKLITEIPKVAIFVIFYYIQMRTVVLYEWAIFQHLNDEKRKNGRGFCWMGKYTSVFRDFYTSRILWFGFE